MPPSFHAFVDESGIDHYSADGHIPLDEEWFVVGTIMIPFDQVSAVTRSVKERFMADCGKTALPIHLTKLRNHHHRLRLVKILSEQTISVAIVMMHKPSFNKASALRTSPFLYNYALKYLIERISAFTRDNHPGTSGDGTVHITFSKKDRYGTENISTYIKRVISVDGSRIDSKHVVPDQMDIQDAESHDGLRLADTIASAGGYAINPHCGETESRYLRILSGKLFRQYKTAFGNGLKIFPDAVGISTDLPHADKVRKRVLRLQSQFDGK